MGSAASPVRVEVLHISKTRVSMTPSTTSTSSAMIGLSQRRPRLGYEGHDTKHIKKQISDIRYNRHQA